MNFEDIQAIFFAECDEALVAAEQGLAACRAGRIAQATESREVSTDD